MLFNELLDRALIDPYRGPDDDAPASLTYGLTPTQSTGSSAAQVEADFAALFAAHEGGDLKRSLGVLSPTTELALCQLRTTAGVKVFPNMGATGGTIWNVPFVTTTACDLTGSPGGRVVALIDGSKVLVADNGLIEFALSSVAAVQMVDDPTTAAANLISALQTNTRFVRLLRSINFQRAASDAVSYTTVAY